MASKLGRNPVACWCGSGKKYIKCHLRQELPHVYRHDQQYYLWFLVEDAASAQRWETLPELLVGWADIADEHVMRSVPRPRPEKKGDRNGGNIYALQEMLGHTSLDMVRRYQDRTGGRGEHTPADRWRLYSVSVL
jgi:hypothetical protein